MPSTIIIIQVILNIITLVYGVDYLFIESDLSLTLSQICVNQRNKIFTKSKENSLIKNYFKQNVCVFEAFDRNEINYLKNFNLKNFNLFFELEDKNELTLTDKQDLTELASMYNNIVFIVMQCDSLEETARSLLNNYKNFRAYVVCYENGLSRVKVAYVRPVINACHRFDGIMYSTDNKVKDMIKSKTCDLNGSVLTLSVNSDLPYCDIGFKDNKYLMRDSIEVFMINVLTKKYNFNYDIIYANQSWGTFQNFSGHSGQSGVWLGSIGHLYNKTADLAICDLTRNYQRSQAVDFTNDYILVPLTFATIKPGLKSRKWITLTPFAPEVWLSILSSLVLTTILFQVLYKKFIPLNKRSDAITISLIASLFQQSIKIPWDNFVIRFYMGIWLLTSLILTTTYSGVFYSVLTLPNYKDPLETLDDLVMAAESGKYTVVTFPLSSYYDLFDLTECCGDYYRIAQNMKSAGIQFPESTKTGIEMINESKEKIIIFINLQVSLAFGVRSTATVDMHISSESLLVDHMAMGLQKGSPLLKPMNEAIGQFVENGLYDSWMSKTLRRIPAKYHVGEQTRPSESIRNFKLKDLQSIFHICILGLFAGLSVFLVEYSVLRRLKKYGFNWSQIFSKLITFEWSRKWRRTERRSLAQLTFLWEHITF